MRKREIKEMAEKYGMEILRHHITHEAWGLGLDTPAPIQELEDLQKEIDQRGRPPMPNEIEMTTEYLPGSIRYKLYCPQTWFDLAGWKVVESGETDEA